MASRLNEFKEFISKHPLIRDEVNSKNKSWQEIYEKWVILGDSDAEWNRYIKTEKKKQDVKEIFNNQKIKNVFEYVKKIDPNKVNNTINNMQKVIQIIQTFSGNKSININNASAFSDWWD